MGTVYLAEDTILGREVALKVVTASNTDPEMARRMLHEARIVARLRQRLHRVNVPTLFISGTLDGRTYPAEAAVTAADFANGKRLIVENGGHNIYEADPRIGEAVLAWFKGQPVPATIHFDPPKIATP